MTVTPRPLRPLRAALCLALVLGAGCHYANPKGSQALEPVRRLQTLPPGAEVHLERLNLLLESDCDLPMDAELDDVMTIRKDGYLPYHGTLGELPQVAMGTYQCKLVRR